MDMAKSASTGHGGELVYVFHTAILAGYKYTPDEIVLSDTMIHYWTNFARYGNPNGDFGSGSTDTDNYGFKPQVSTHKCMHTRTHHRHHSMYTRTQIHMHLVACS